MTNDEDLNSVMELNEQLFNINDINNDNNDEKPWFDKNENGNKNKNNKNENK